MIILTTAVILTLANLHVWGILSGYTLAAATSCPESAQHCIASTILTIYMIGVFCGFAALYVVKSAYHYFRGALISPPPASGDALTDRWEDR